MNETPGYDVLIVAPLDYEWDAVVKRIDERKEMTLQSCNGKIGQLRVVCIQAGKFQEIAAARVAVAIEVYDPRIVIICGTAGSLPKYDFKRGDIILANHVYGVCGKMTEHGLIRRPNLDWEPNSDLVDGMKSFKIQHPNWLIGIRQPCPDKRRTQPIKVDDGFVLSTDFTFDTYNQKFVQELLGEKTEVHAVEMEAVGIGAAIKNCQLKHHVNGVMIRSIMDLVRSSSLQGTKATSGRRQREKWKPYASDVAASFVHSFLLQLSLDQVAKKTVTPASDNPIASALKTPLGKTLPTIFEEFERTFQPTTETNFKVRQAISERELAHLIALDSNSTGEGFLEPNRYKEQLKKMWEKDKFGFYVVYDHNDNPVGYCDVFCLNPDTKFIESELLCKAPGELDLPDTDKLCGAIVPRDLWGDRTLDIYIDAVMVLEPYRPQAVWQLIRFVCEDLKRFSYVRVSRIATVVVDNKLPSGFSPSVADNPRRNKCHGAKLALRAGLSWKKYKKLGFEKTMGLGRYLYVTEFHEKPSISIWALHAFAPTMKKILQRWPHMHARLIRELFM